MGVVDAEGTQEQWSAIADELLGEVGGRLWRNREAACLGLADLLQVFCLAEILPDMFRPMFICLFGLFLSRIIVCIICSGRWQGVCGIAQEAREHLLRN